MPETQEGYGPFESYTEVSCKYGTFGLRPGQVLTVEDGTVSISDPEPAEPEDAPESAEVEPAEVTESDPEPAEPEEVVIPEPGDDDDLDEPEPAPA